MADPDYPDLAQWFLTRGYVVVIPQRPGHGRTGGPYLESAGTCERPDFKSAGLAGAQVLANVIEFMRTQSFVNKDPVILIGHSAGGWASLALAGQRPELVRSVIVFAAGRGGRSNDKPHANCAPDLLVSVAAEFGASARAPVVWIYAENDTYFSPRLGRNIATAYARGGAPMTFLVAPPGSEDGHFLIHEKRAISVASSALARTVKGAQN
jgi:pimeloyl-ACP methyl ester carboxylesterase